MNGYQIYDIAKQASYEAGIGAASDDGWYDDELYAPRRSLVARIGDGLRRVILALRGAQNDTARSETLAG